MENEKRIDLDSPNSNQLAAQKLSSDPLSAQNLKSDYYQSQELNMDLNPVERSNIKEDEQFVKVHIDHKRVKKLFRETIEITIRLDRMPPIREEDNNDSEKANKSPSRENKEPIITDKKDGYEADKENDSEESYDYTDSSEYETDEDDDNDEMGSASALSAETKNKYKHLTFDDMNTSLVDVDDYCLICTGEFEEQELSTVICGHKFHKDCIDGWLLIDKDNCPICNTYLGDPSEDEDTESSCSTCHFPWKENYERIMLEQYKKAEEIYQLENESDTEFEEKAKKFIDPEDKIQQEIINDMIEARKKGITYAEQCRLRSQDKKGNEEKGSEISQQDGE